MLICTYSFSSSGGCGDASSFETGVGDDDALALSALAAETVVGFGVVSGVCCCCGLLSRNTEILVVREGYNDADDDAGGAALASQCARKSRLLVVVAEAANGNRCGSSEGCRVNCTDGC